MGQAIGGPILGNITGAAGGDLKSAGRGLFDPLGIDPLLGTVLAPDTQSFKAPKKRPIPPPPSILDPSVSASVRRRRASATAAAGATILTGPQGLTSEAATSKKSLLGT